MYYEVLAFKNKHMALHWFVPKGYEIPIRQDFDGRMKRSELESWIRDLKSFDKKFGKLMEQREEEDSGRKASNGYLIMDNMRVARELIRVAKLFTAGFDGDRRPVDSDYHEWSNEDQRGFERWVKKLERQYEKIYADTIQWMINNRRYRSLEFVIELAGENIDEGITLKETKEQLEASVEGILDDLRKEMKNA